MATFTSGVTARHADQRFGVSNQKLEDSVARDHRYAMQQGTAFLCQGPDGQLGLFQLDQIAEGGIRVLKKLYPP
jgi:hypothetical protein